MPGPPTRLPSAGLRSAGSGPLSPTASSGGGYSASGQAGMGLASSSTLLPMSRTSSGVSALAGGTCRPPSGPGMAGPGSTSSSSAAAAASSSPASKWQPGASRAPSLSGSNSPSNAAASSTAPGSLAAVSRHGARPASGRATTGATPGASASAAPAPAGSLTGLDPDLQQRLEAATAQLGSREWKERLEGLEAVQQAVAPGAAAALPQEAQLWLFDALSQRAVDANLRVQQQVRSAAKNSRCILLAPACMAAYPTWLCG